MLRLQPLLLKVVLDEFPRLFLSVRWLLAVPLGFHPPALAHVDKVVRSTRPINQLLLLVLLEFSQAERLRCGLSNFFVDLGLLILEVARECRIIVQVFVVLRLQEACPRLELRPDRRLPV